MTTKLEIKARADEAKLQNIISNIHPLATHLPRLYVAIVGQIKEDRPQRHRTWAKTDMSRLIYDWHDTAAEDEKPALELYLAARAIHHTMSHYTSDRFSQIISKRKLDVWATTTLNKNIMRLEEGGEEDVEELLDTVEGEADEELVSAAAAAALASAATTDIEPQFVKKEITAEEEKAGMQSIPAAQPAAITAEPATSQQKQPAKPRLASYAHAGPSKTKSNAEEKKRPAVPSKSPATKRPKYKILEHAGTQTCPSYANASTQTIDLQSRQTPASQAPVSLAPPSTSSTINLPATTAPSDLAAQDQPGAADANASLAAQIEASVSGALARHTEQMQASMRDFYAATVRGSAMGNDEMFYQTTRQGGRPRMVGYEYRSFGEPSPAMATMHQRAFPPAPMSGGSTGGAPGRMVNYHGPLTHFEGMEYEDMVHYGRRPSFWRG